MRYKRSRKKGKDDRRQRDVGAGIKRSASPCFLTYFLPHSLPSLLPSLFPSFPATLFPSCYLLSFLSSLSAFCCSSFDSRCVKSPFLTFSSFLLCDFPFDSFDFLFSSFPFLSFLCLYLLTLLTVRNNLHSLNVRANDRTRREEWVFILIISKFWIHMQTLIFIK
jgi:hypothetical protein